MGKIIKNGIEYSGVGGGSGITEDRVNELINSAFSKCIKRIALPVVEYTIPAKSCEDVFIDFSSVVPSDYVPIAISDADYGYGGDVFVGIKRFHAAFDDTRVCIALTNDTNTEVSSKLLVRVICAKKSMVGYIN